MFPGAIPLIDYCSTDSGLPRLFPGAIPLIDYCNSVIATECEESVMLLSSDSEAYKDLLITTLIIPPTEDTKVAKRFRVDRKDKFPIQDIVGRLVSLVVRSNHSYQELNCLALGYRLKTSNSDATMRTNNDTELFFVNTMQSLVKTQTWQLLANRIGNSTKRRVQFAQPCSKLCRFRHAADSRVPESCQFRTSNYHHSSVQVVLQCTLREERWTA